MFKLTGLADLGKKAADLLKKAFKGAFEDPQLTLSVGIWSGASRDGGGASVAEYAAYNEFGTTRIPPRPFLRPAMEERREEWTETIKGSMASSLKGGQFNNRSVLEVIGKNAVKDVQLRILSNTPPPNAPSTVARKKAKGISPVRTLVETGLMHDSVEFKIEKGTPS